MDIRDSCFPHPANNCAGTLMITEVFTHPNPKKGS